MTANQIAYWNLQEQKRSNLADEAERKRHNVADEKLKRTATLAKGFGDVLKAAPKLFLA